MACELIQRITIKRDGIYISTHSNNDTSHYKSIRVDFLSKAYQENGQFGLDKEIIDMCFYNCELRRNHKSIIPYREAINKAIQDPKFIEIRNEYDELEDKAFNITNRFEEYKSLTKEESEKMYSALKPTLDRLRNKRNEYVAKIVENERKKMNEPKEIKEGIYEIIPVHIVTEGLREVYTEYMNFNSNNGTIIYEKTLGNLSSDPEKIKISDYQNIINKNGINNVAGAKEFKEFIKKYPQIYIKGARNEKYIEDNNKLSLKDNDEEEEI